MFSVRMVREIMEQIIAEDFQQVPDITKNRISFIFGGFGGTVVIENLIRENRMIEEHKQTSKTVRRTRRMSCAIKSNLLQDFGFKDWISVKGDPGLTDPPPKWTFEPGKLEHEERFNKITDKRTWMSFSAQSVLDLSADAALFHISKVIGAVHAGKSWKTQFFLEGCVYQPCTEQGWQCIFPPPCEADRRLFFWVLGNIADSSALAWPIEKVNLPSFGSTFCLASDHRTLFAKLQVNVHCCN